MSINFDELPEDKPSGFPVAETGTYKARIKEAKMLKVKGDSTEQYLNVQFEVLNEKGVKVVIYDKFFDREKPLLRFKLKRFITAAGLHLSGSFELRDLCKILPNKEMYIAVKLEQNTGYAAQNVVDIFADDIYTACNETGSPLTEEVSKDDLPFEFNASDSASDTNKGAEEY